MVIVLGHEEGEGALGQPHRPELPDLHPPCLGRWAMCSLPAATPAGKAFFLATACGSSQAGDLTCATAATRAAAVTTLDL